MSVKVGITVLAHRAACYRALQDRREVEIAAINDLTDSATLAHLLQYDFCTVNFRHGGSAGDKLLINGR